MARLIIKNIGPIKDVDIELKKVNVFVLLVHLDLVNLPCLDVLTSLKHQHQEI